MTAVEENVLIIRKFLIIEHITHLICQPHYIIFCDVCQDVEGREFFNNNKATLNQVRGKSKTTFLQLFIVISFAIDTMNSDIRCTRF